jgi:hypothetical protein
MAFAGIVAVGLGWAVLAGWALIRRPLFAVDRLLAGTLAVVVTTLMSVASVSIAWSRGSVSGALLAGAVGVVLMTVAVLTLVRARAYRAALLARWRDLQPPSSAGREAPVMTHELLPIGVLGIALRHLHGAAGGRRIVVLAVVLTVLLLFGAVLLLR